MALINCPECGERISSNAKQCIHCGCKFTACPECGKVSVGEISVCPDCGFELKATSNAPKFIKNVSAEDSGSELYKDDLLGTWQKTSFADGKILKILKFVEIGAHIAAVLLIAVAVILFMVWKQSDVLEKLAGIKDLQTSLKCLVAFACIFEIFDMVIETVKDSFIKLRCSSWISRRTNFDAYAYIREHDRFMGTENDVNNLRLFIEATYLSETQRGKSAVYFGLIAKIVCAVALWTCAGICIMQNAEQLIKVACIDGLKFEFQYHALIGVGVAVVLYFLTFITDIRYENRLNAWIDQSFPDLAE